MSIKAVEAIKIPQMEGEIDLVYGPIGGGKNTLATEMVLNDLHAGYKVFATWPVGFEGVDETRHIVPVVMGLFGIKRRYRVLGKGNFQLMTLRDMMAPDFLKKLSEITDCAFYIDEGYAAPLFDSYRKTHLSVEERMQVYITRHLNRKFVIVAQRPNAIHVSSRAMVNRFYKCEQLVPKFLTRIFHFYIFRRTEFQDMLDETVDETKPYSTHIKFMTFNSSIFKMFDSKYMREGREVKYPPDIKEFDVSYFSRWGLLFSGFSFGGGTGAAIAAPGPQLRRRSIRDIISKRSSR